MGKVFEFKMTSWKLGTEDLHVEADHVIKAETYEDAYKKAEEINPEGTFDLLAPMEYFDEYAPALDEPCFEYDF